MYSVEVAESMPTAVLVANPTAQSGKAAEWIAQARRLLDAAGEIGRAHV